MIERAVFRLRDMKQSAQNIRALLKGHTLETMYGDAVARAAFERFLEILSEASRHVPTEWKQAAAPALPWRQIADLGNHIRHAYHKLDAEILWNIYAEHLDALEAAVDVMIERHDPSL